MLQKIVNSRVAVSINTIVNPIMEGFESIRMDLPFQRPEDQHNIAWKSNLVASVLNGYPIPVVYCAAEEDNTMNILDGIQRVTTLRQFYNNKLRLHKDTPALRDGTVIAGKTFKDLCKIRELSDNKIASMTESEQLAYNSELRLKKNMENRFLQTNLEFWNISGMTPDELANYFRLLNSGAPVATIHTILSRFGPMVDFIGEAANHGFFNDSVKQTKAARLASMAKENVIQCFSLLTNSYSGFASAELDALIERHNTNGVDDDAVTTFTEISDYLFDCFPVSYDDKGKPDVEYPILKKTMLPIMFKIAGEALLNSVEPEAFRNWVEKFFASNAYTSKAQSGTGKLGSILDRLFVAVDDFKRTFGIDVHESLTKPFWANLKAIDDKAKADADAKAAADKLEAKQRADEAKKQRAIAREIKKAENDAKRATREAEKAAKEAAKTNVKKAQMDTMALAAKLIEDNNNSVGMESLDGIDTSMSFDDISADVDVNTDVDDEDIVDLDKLFQ